MRGKVIRITYFCTRVRECVRACGWVRERVGVGVFVRACSLTQHVKRMNPILLSCVDCLAPPYFSTLSHKGHSFEKKNEHKIFFFIFSTSFIRNFSHSNKDSAR